MAATRRSRMAMLSFVLLAVRQTEAVPADENDNGVDTFLTELQSALDTRQTNVARMEGCDVHQVGSECERVTSEEDGPTRPDETLIRQAMLPKDERDAMAKSGKIVNTDAEPIERSILPPGVSEVDGKPVRIEAGATTRSGIQSPAAAGLTEYAPEGVKRSTGQRVTRVARGASRVPPVRRGPCRSRNGLFPHRNPTRYYQCKSGRYLLKRCAKGLVFDGTLQYCKASPRVVEKVAASGAVNIGGALAGAILGAASTETVKNVYEDGKKLLIDNRNELSKGTWRCHKEPTGRSWEARDATVDQCWDEALRRNSMVLLVSASGCQFWESRPKTLKSTKCTRAAYHVIDVQRIRSDLARLQPNMQFWVSARSPTDIIWGTVPNIPRHPDVRACGEFCYKFGQDFARVDHRGCRCGRAGRQRVTIRQEDLRFLRKRQALIDPGFTIQLHARGLENWRCTAAPADFIRITASENLQEALVACRERRFKFLTPGKDGFYCGNSTDKLEQFSRSQCQMNVTTTRAYSVISIQAIERQIVQVEKSLYDYVLWWVSSRPEGVFWNSLLGVTQLEQCVINCDRRFVAVGPDGCFCGSMQEGVPKLHLHEWVQNNQRTDTNPSKGYLMLDKLGSLNVPEGWHCATSLKDWKVYTNAVTGGKVNPGLRKYSSLCIRRCIEEEYAYAAMGSSSCKCGGHQYAQLRHLPMARCQTASAKETTYSVIALDVWKRNVELAKRNSEHKLVCWVSRKPLGTTWETQPGANVLEQCINTCNDQRSVTFISLGVNGCECGFGKTIERPSELCSPTVTNSMLFLLIERTSPSKGYTPPEFKWIVKANSTKVDRKFNVKVEPWIRMTATNATERRSKTIDGGYYVEAKAENQVRSNFSGFRVVTDGRNHSITNVKDVELLVTDKNNYTQDGTTQSGKRGNSDVRLQRLRQKDREWKDMRTSEDHKIKAGENEISIQSVKDSNITIDREFRDKLSLDDYKKQYVKGHRTTYTSARYAGETDENMERATITSSDMLKKDLLVNQTHGDSMSVDARMDRKNVKLSTAKEHSEGRTVIAEIHVEGSCYNGSADRNKWTDSAAFMSPFKCLCFCLRKQKLYYAIYDGGNCFCAKKRSKFGADMGITTTNGRCPDGGRVVYDGIKHAHDLGRYCRTRKQTSIIDFLRKSINKGHRVVEFSNSELMEARINSSSLRGTHLNRADDETAKTVRRWHGKEGTTHNRWMSRLIKGPRKNQYGLRLQVEQRHAYKEHMNLTTHEHVQNTHSARGVPFRSGTGYKLVGKSEVRPRIGAGTGLLSHGSRTTADTPTGRVTSPTQRGDDGVSTGSKSLNLLTSVKDAVMKPVATAVGKVADLARKVVGCKDD